MCFDNGAGAAAAAAKAQQDAINAQEQKRQDAITQGKSAIDSAFSKFDTPYYDKYTQDYRGAYLPQLNDHYGVAKDKMIAALAGRGTLDSSIGADALGQLAKKNYDAQAQISNSAVDATNSFRSSVENAKTNMYNLNASSSDAYSMANRAQATAGAIVAPQTYGSLGDVFNSTLAPWITATKVNSASMSPWFNTGNGSYGSVVYG